MNYLRARLINWLLPSSVRGASLLTAPQLEALIKSHAERIAAAACAQGEDVVRCAHIAQLARGIVQLADRRRFLRLSQQGMDSHETQDAKSGALG